MILAALLLLAPAASEPAPTVSVQVDAGAGVHAQTLRPGPWRMPAGWGAAFVIEPELARGRWRLSIPVEYRSSVGAELREEAPGVRRPVRVDTTAGGVRGVRRIVTRGWAIDVGASVWSGRFKLAAPRPGRLPDFTTPLLRGGVPLRVARGRWQWTVEPAGGVAFDTTAAFHWAVRSDLRVRIAGPWIAALRLFEDGWLHRGGVTAGHTVTAGVGVRAPGARPKPRPRMPPPDPVRPRAEAERRAPAPALKGTASDGTPFDLEALRGSVVVVDFWASWCGPCRAAMPKLQALHSAWEDVDVVVVGVSMDEDAEAARAFAQEAGITFDWILDEGDLAQTWAPPKMPTTFIVDRDGNLAHVHAGYHDGDAVEIEAEVDALLDEPR